MKRKSKQKSSPIWPYLGILACLFFLSLTAPRAWERRARREPQLASRSSAERTSPIAERDVAPPAPATALEPADVAELAPRAEPLDLTLPAAAPAAPLPEPELMLPPAPEYAQEFQLEALDLANLPEVPTTAEPAAIKAPEGPQPAAEIDAVEFQPAITQLDETPASPIEPSAAEPPVTDTDRAPADGPVIAEQPVVVEKRAAADESSVAEPETLWPRPRVLVEQLSGLAETSSPPAWSVETLELVNTICSEADDEARQQAIDRLRGLVDQAQSTGPDSSPQAARARYGMIRWLDVWEAAGRLRSSNEVQTERVSLDRMRRRLADFDRLADGDPAGPAWRDYLRLETLIDEAASEEQRGEAARAVLSRLDSPRLSEAQRAFATGPGLSRLREDLKTWAAQTVNVDELLANLEQFEQSGLPSDAALVAENFRQLQLSSGEKPAALGKHLDTHYRNANLRVAVSGELANRFVPQPGRIDAPVRDTVVNVPVRGHSSTFTKLSLILVPDASRIRLGLEAQGVVDARTISSAGPATFRNQGQSTFLVRKLFVLGPRGLHVWPAIAEAENNYNYLVSLETDYDGVPLVGSLVRNIARSQHDEIRSEARRQTEQKVAIKALNQLDSEIQTRLDEAEGKVKQGQLATLKRLGMELVPISLSTSEDRIVGRVRLAGPDQLGAHTARPRAPSDSWLSVQVHQSVLNNTLQSLDLEGRSFELESLFAWVGQKLNRPEMANQEELPENVKITFADKDAIRLRAVDNRIEVTFAIAELTHEGSRWRNFQVRTHYAPEAEGLSPRFARVDTIHLDGKSLRGKIEFKLRAIFSKVLSKNRELRLLPDSLISDAKFRDLQMTQFTIDDGWIALAYSPRRAGSNLARRPK